MSDPQQLLNVQNAFVEQFVRLATFPGPMSAFNVFMRPDVLQAQAMAAFWTAMGPLLAMSTATQGAASAMWGTMPAFMGIGPAFMGMGPASMQAMASPRSWLPRIEITQ
ncbi:MAG: hypothetical protein AAF654_05220 [Myxococcota bacterium]